MASVAPTIPSAPGLMLPRAAGRSRMAPIGPSCDVGAPRNGNTCISMDDDADAGHEPGDHDGRRVGHEASDLEHAEQDLQQPAHDHHGQGLGEIGCVGRDDDRHGNGHRWGGAGYLRSCAAERRREKTDRDGAVQPRGRSQARCDAECQRHRQRDHCRGKASEEIAPERLEIVVHVDPIVPNNGPKFLQRGVGQRGRACPRFTCLSILLLQGSGGEKPAIVLEQGGCLFDQRRAVDSIPGNDRNPALGHLPLTLLP